LVCFELVGALRESEKEKKMREGTADLNKAQTNFLRWDSSEGQAIVEDRLR
jgi:hypothetical protein